MHAEIQARVLQTIWWLPRWILYHGTNLLFLDRLLDLGMVEGRVADECLLGDADDEVSDGTKRSAPLAPGIAQESKLRKLAHAA